MTSYSISDIIGIIQTRDVELIYDQSMVYINESLRQYSHNIKKEIDKKSKSWEKYKKYSNPYEFINTSYDNNTMPICSYKPLSRSYFKMIEILNHYSFSFPDTMISFHLAEGPGGFIEALSNYRNNPKDVYYGMTLMEERNDIPKWKKNEIYLDIHKHISLEYGHDNTGNLYHKTNLEYVYNKYKHSIDFVTGDGGFDYSMDFNKQEEHSLNLIFSQICFAMCLQKKGGSFVLKLFDTFTSLSVEMIYLLNYLYEEIYIIKPLTSRPANSEKYIICINFRMVKNIDQIIEKIIKSYDVQHKSITGIFNIEIPLIFLDKIKEINSITGQTQIEHIQHVLSYLLDENRNTNLDNIKRSYLLKCIKWCKKHHLPVEEQFV
jgi:23S rRNA U2552 (ribose-2'-O)-methylase RlmE/FtsJ